MVALTELCLKDPERSNIQRAFSRRRNCGEDTEHGEIRQGMRVAVASELDFEALGVAQTASAC